VLAVAMMAAIFLVPRAPAFSWVPARTGSPWLVAVALMALCGGAAVLGAVAARSITARRARASLLVVMSGTTTMGLAVTLLYAIAGVVSADVHRSVAAMLLVFTVALVASGFTTQRMSPIYAPWLSSSGAFLIAAMGYVSKGGRTGWTEMVASLAIGALVWPVGYLGARLAWSWLGGRHEPERHDDLSNIFS